MLLVCAQCKLNGIYDSMGFSVNQMLQLDALAKLKSAK